MLRYERALQHHDYLFGMSVLFWVCASRCSNGDEGVCLLGAGCDWDPPSRTSFNPHWRNHVSITSSPTVPRLQMADILFWLFMLLPRRVTAVYSQVRPRHERAGIADQEHGCTTVLLGS